MKDADHVTFATFFPGSLNIHLIKDVGMIPYVLHREYGYDSYMICYRNEEFTYLSEVPGLKMLTIRKGLGYYTARFVRRLFGYSSRVFKLAEPLCIALDSLPLLLLNGRKFDVLQLYHFKEESMLVSLIYRLVNRKGIIYIKMDMDPDIIKVYRGHPEKGETTGQKLSYRFFKRLPVNIFSVESKKVFEFIRSEHPLFKKFADRICYIPNGIDMKAIPATSAKQKENIVLHAGRIGNPQKGTEVILEAFSHIAAEFPGWKLVLVGPMDDTFKSTFADFLRMHPDIGDRIAYAGFMESREDLFKWYERSKILAFPSRFESFGLVLVEAQVFGDVVVGSDIPAVRELTDDGTLGYLCPAGDVDRFSDTLRYAMSHEDELAAKSALAAGFARDNFDWNAICGRLHAKICDERKKRMGR